MAMTAVRVSSLNVCNGVVLTSDEQGVRSCLNSNLLFVFDAVCCRESTLMYVLSKYTTMAITVVRLMFVGCMTRWCHVHLGQTDGAFVLVCA